MPLLLDENDPIAGSSARRGPLSPSGPDLGVIEEARRRQRARRIRLALCAALAVTVAGLTAALLHAGGSPSSRTMARVPGGAATRRKAAAFGVQLSPALDGGEHGWCVGIEEADSKGTVGGGCSMTPVASAPVAFRMTGGNVETDTQWTVLVTTPNVAAVLVNGSARVPTVALPGLPYGRSGLLRWVARRQRRLSHSCSLRRCMARGRGRERSRPTRAAAAASDARGEAPARLSRRHRNVLRCTPPVRA